MTNFFKKNIATIFVQWYSFLTLAIIAVNFSSCTAIKTSTYFKNMNRDTVLTVPNLHIDELKIQKGDILNLSVSSLNKDEDALYNTIGGGYEVNNSGEIHVHHLGKIIVEGLTRKQLKAKLEEDLKPYLRDPVVVVGFANHHITILGSIGNPQILALPAEKISILDVLAMSGTVIATTSVSDVIIIRDSSSDKKQIRHINLEDHSVFNSDFFYLQPNDVVVVRPDEKIILEEMKRQRYQQVSSIVLQSITIALIIYQTFFRK